MTEYLNSGAIVKSIAGREKNQIFLILKVDKNNAYLVNGKTRQLNCPKKKNFKHLYLLEKSSNLDMDKLTDGDIIKYLKDYIKSRDRK